MPSEVNDSTIFNDPDKRKRTAQETEHYFATGPDYGEIAKQKVMGFLGVGKNPQKEALSRKMADYDNSEE